MEAFSFHAEAYIFFLYYLYSLRIKWNHLKVNIRGKFTNQIVIQNSRLSLCTPDPSGAFHQTV